MNLNLLLFLGTVVNIVVGATLPSQYLQFTKSITNTVSSLYASPTSPNVLTPRQWGCGFWADDPSRNEGNNCFERNGRYINGISANCEHKYVCFLPSGEKKIFPFAIKAQDPSECIEIEGKYYCSADLSNIECPDCTFTQFVQKVDSTIGGHFFTYKNIDVTQITTPIELPTDTDEKIKCLKDNTFIGSRERDCTNRKGYYINMSFYPDCDEEYYACLLPNNRKISKNGVVARNLSECITIANDPMRFFAPLTAKYCSVDSTNISCSEGKECTFTELLQEIGNTYGDYFPYEKSNSTSIEPVTIPQKEFCNKNDGTYYLQERNCETRNGVIIKGYPVDDDGICDIKYACFLPSGNARLFPDAFKAQDPSECIIINGRNYCSVDLNNIECPDCTFTQFTEKVKDIFDYNFENVDMTKLTEPILLPKDVPSKNIECINRYPSVPQIPYNTCKEIDGIFFSMEFYPDCEKTYYTCFIPQYREPEESAIKAQDPSECITIASTVYCAADYYDGVTCPEGKDDCTFTEYVQEMARIYGDYFDYEPYIPEVTTEIATEIATEIITDFTTDSIADLY